MRKLIRSLFCLVLLGAQPAIAAESPWASTAEMQARIVLEHETIAPDQSQISAALQTRLAPGWHSYWRSPGESGLAPVVHWDRSSNIAAFAMEFPAPKRFKEMDLTTFGYDGDVTYPLNITLKEAGKPAKLDLVLDIMVCNEICIPASLPVQLEIAAGDGADSAHISVIDYARKKVPQNSENAQLKIENVVVAKETIVANLFSKRGFARADVIAEIGDIALAAAPQIQPDDKDKTRARAVIAIPAALQDELGGQAKAGEVPYAGQTIRLTLIDGRNAVEQIITLE